MGAGRGKGAAEEQVQVQQIGDLIWGHQGVGRAASASPGHAACGEKRSS